MGGVLFDVFDGLCPSLADVALSGLVASKRGHPK
jgi:hypothetical protein